MELSPLILGRACYICMVALGLLFISCVNCGATSPSTTTTNSTICANTNCTATIPTPEDDSSKSNDTNLYDRTWKKVSENKEMLQRAFYVLLGITGIVVVYFVVRAIRLRHRRSRTRRYGLLSGRGDKLEMAPLDGDDEDEEDITVYEMNGKRLR